MTPFTSWDLSCRDVCHQGHCEGRNRRRASLAHQHPLGFALQVDVRLATDVDGDPFDRASGEAVGTLPGVVLCHRVPDVAAHGQALAGDHVTAGLELDPSLADLRVTV